MPDTLKEILLDDSRRSTVVTDMGALIDGEVSAKSGVSGTVVKTGYGAVKKLKPGIIDAAVDSLLDDFVAKLEPFYGDYRGSGGSDFGSYLQERGDEVSDELLAITDARAEGSNREAIKKVYDKLRPQGKSNVEQALPAVGQLIDKHAAAA